MIITVWSQVRRNSFSQSFFCSHCSYRHLHRHTPASIFARPVSSIPGLIPPFHLHQQRPQIRPPNNCGSLSQRILRKSLLTWNARQSHLMHNGFDAPIPQGRLSGTLADRTYMRHPPPPFQLHTYAETGVVKAAKATAYRSVSIHVIP